MADSIKEEIMKNFVTILKAVTVAGGYSNTINSVQRYNQAGNEKANVPYVVIEVGEDAPREGGENPLTDLDLDIWLKVGTRQDKTVDPKSSDEVMISLESDIKRAVLGGFQLGGNAIDTKHIKSSPSPFAVDGQPEIEMDMLFSVHYRHKRDDPYSLT